MKLICVSGPSGVGKSTVSLLIQCLVDKSYIFCGDNYHKYERNNLIWNTKTHLDPSCNDLDDAEICITKLLRNNNSFVRHYNHSTGTFQDLDRIIIDDKTTVIYEGLHSFYLKNIIPDLKIYVDTNEELTTEWKIERDCKKRGYTKEKVIDSISRRKPDEKKYILPQKENADIIIKFDKYHDSIDISYVPYSNKGEDKEVQRFMSKLVHLYRSMIEFIKYSRLISSNINLVQNVGGNLSYKVFEDLMIIKSSGSRMHDCNLFDGYSVCKISNKKCYQNSDEYKNEIFNVSKYGKPSMEYGFHAFLNMPVVLHVHPLNLLSILCSQESRLILNDKFHNTNIEGKIIEYVTPGFELSNRISLDRMSCKSSIYYLENHGLIVCSWTFKEAYDIASRIEKYSAEVINDMCYNKPYFNDTNESGILFPDHAIFPKENEEYANYILRNITNCGLTPIFLSESETLKLSSDMSEIYRKNKIL